jgi:hypothetical protein
MNEWMNLPLDRATEMLYRWQHEPRKLWILLTGPNNPVNTVEAEFGFEGNFRGAFGADLTRVRD